MLPLCLFALRYKLVTLASGHSNDGPLPPFDVTPCEAEIAGGASLSLTVRFSADHKTFGHAIKNGALPASTEVTTFEHNCSAAPCTITQVHVPSIYPPAGEAWNWTHGVVSFIQPQLGAGFVFCGPKVGRFCTRSGPPLSTLGTMRRKSWTSILQRRQASAV